MRPTSTIIQEAVILQDRTIYKEETHWLVMRLFKIVDLSTDSSTNYVPLLILESLHFSHFTFYIFHFLVDHGIAKKYEYFYMSKIIFIQCEANITIIVDIGTNDLSLAGVDPSRFASRIVALAQSLRCRK